MADRKVIYKNHCTPQEKVNFSGGANDGRWYLDSDAGRKLTGIANIDLDTFVYNTDVAVSTAANIPTPYTGNDFLFIKNLGGGGGADVHIALDATNYKIVISPGESFASKVITGVSAKIKCLASDSTCEILTGKS